MNAEQIADYRDNVVQAHSDFAVAIRDFLGAFIEASSWVPEFEGEDAEMLLLMGIAL